MEKLLTRDDLTRIINEAERPVLIHNMEGEIIGGSPPACLELGYTQEELTQMLLANIKAHNVRISDVCVDHKDVSPPVVFQRRNGRRFAAKVKSQILRADLDRTVQTVVQLELDILQDGSAINTNTVQFNVQESADYLELLSHEMHAPLMKIGSFLDNLSGRIDLADEEKLPGIVEARKQLTTLMNDVVDWFKIGVNVLSLERNPFNILSVLDGLVTESKDFSKRLPVKFSIGVTSKQCELVFGDQKRVNQLLTRLIQKILALPDVEKINILLENDEDGKNPNNVIFILNAYFSNIVEPHDSWNSDSTLGIIGKLVRIMGGQIKTAWKNPNCQVFEFGIYLPNVDTLDLQGNSEFLKNHNVILIDDDKSLLGYQLNQWGAIVYQFDSCSSALDYICQIPKSIDILMLLYNGKDEPGEMLENLQTMLSQVCTKAFIFGVICEKKPVLFRVKNLFFLEYPSEPAALGNEIATQLGVPLPYPYSSQQRLRTNGNGQTQKRILFVDDVETIRITFRAMLEKQGFEVDLAHNGIDAILACNQKTYDVIIVDFQMPYMDGLEATSHIRKSANLNSDTPIIAVSGDTSKNARAMAAKVGIQQVLAKPVAMEDLLQEINVYALNEMKSIVEGEAEQEKSTFQGRRSYDNQSIKGINNYLNKSALESLIADTSLQTCMEMVDIFMEESKHSIHVIDQEARHQNWDRVMSEAHAIKSTSFTFGCEALYKISSQLEAEIQQAQADKCEQTVDAMAAVFAESYLALEEYFAGQKGCDGDRL